MIEIFFLGVFTLKFFYSECVFLPFFNKNNLERKIYPRQSRGCVNMCVILSS